jgi:hypothetical protein
MCYVDESQLGLYEYQCPNLLQGLQTYNTADAFLAAGGEFGCWNVLDYPDPDIVNACRPDFQHNIAIADCGRCTSMAVCLKYPPAASSSEGIKAAIAPSG